MEIHINWIAVVVAVVASLVLAKSWYAEASFGGSWRKLSGITPADSKRAGIRPMILTLFANISTVIALAILLDISAEFFNDVSVWHAVATSLIVWVAFSATTLLTHNAFEQKPNKLTLINNGYQLVLFVVVALVISLFGIR